MKYRSGLQSLGYSAEEPTATTKQTPKRGRPAAELVELDYCGKSIWLTAKQLEMVRRIGEGEAVVSVTGNARTATRLGELIHDQLGFPGNTIYRCARLAFGAGLVKF